MTAPDSYAGLGPSRYPLWDIRPSGLFATDPLKALERFRAACEGKMRPNKSPRRGPLYLLHADEYAKAMAGKPFVCGGLLCRMVGGIPVPLP